MSRYLTGALIPFAAIVLMGCGSTSAPNLTDSVEEGQLFENMGPHERTITTNSEEAQAFFNQGLTWMYAFNHDEAILAFRKAAELDPNCAMPWWGISIAAGPQYNHPVMTEARTAIAWEGMQAALERIDQASPVERALIQALEIRNANPEPENRTALNEAYAEAMAKIWKAYPDDPDIGTLYAEALMVRNPWKLYTSDQVPHEDTPEIVTTLKQVLKLDPDNPGALHLLIHAVEPSARPDDGLSAADRLSQLVPSSGHLLHMPSHIYVKTGHWDKAVTQNQKAMAADRDYRSLSPNQLTQHVYMTHNAHMRAYASMMSGREKDAMIAARDMWENVDEGLLRQVGPALDRWMCSVFDVQKRFGRWDAILAEPAPPDFMPITTSTWRAARAVAYAAKKDFVHAEEEYEKFKLARTRVGPDIEWGRDAAQRVLEVSNYFIAGEIELQKGNWEEAEELLEKAAEVEDTLSYGEPPQWLQPVRHTLGALYLKSGKFEEAERVYREDLAKWRNNGWSLYGLARSLEKQGKPEESKLVMLQYRDSWKGADALTDTSCKCILGV